MEASAELYTGCIMSRERAAGTIGYSAVWASDGLSLALKTDIPFFAGI
jgi:hypothetical protein